MTGLNQRIASYMGDSLDLDNDNREVIAYSLELLFHTLTTIFLVMSVVWLIGPVKEAVILLIVMFIFKSFAGGAHCSSATRCTLLSMILIPSFSQLSHVAGQHLTFNMLIVLTILSVLFSWAMVYRLAPVNLPVTSDRHRHNRRTLAFLLIILVTVVQIIFIILLPAQSGSYVIAIDISISWQAFMLTKQGHALVNYFDRLLSFFVRKGGEKG